MSTPIVTILLGSFLGGFLGAIAGLLLPVIFMSFIELQKGRKNSQAIREMMEQAQRNSQASVEGPFGITNPEETEAPFRSVLDQLIQENQEGNSPN
jgi:uncharacterized membrane protein YgaE (UPF0421/DUF939 family)